MCDPCVWQAVAQDEFERLSLAEHIRAQVFTDRVYVMQGTLGDELPDYLQLVTPTWWAWTFYISPPIMADQPPKAVQTIVTRSRWTPLDAIVPSNLERTFTSLKERYDEAYKRSWCWRS
jgi:hypothetical protein